MVNRTQAVLAVVAAGSSAVALWLWSENARLGRQLSGARAEVVTVQERAERAEAELASGGGGAGGGGVRSNPLAVMGALGRAIDKAGEEPSAAPRPPGGGDWEARRADRQQRVRDLLGRKPGETEEEYRARLMPFVETVLSVPRERMAEKRRQFEEAAGLSEEQRGKVDAAFQQAAGEVVALANSAIASGQLTPYERNTKGILDFVGSTVGAVDALDQALGKILTPEQRQIMKESGFDPLEYLGATAPWESLNPPPPPPGESGG
jgi:hypothetical protein